MLVMNFVACAPWEYLAVWHLQTPTKDCSHHQEVLKAVLAANSSLWTGLQAPPMQVWATEPAQLGAGGCFTSMSDTWSGWNTLHFKPFCLKKKKKKKLLYFLFLFLPYFTAAVFLLGIGLLSRHVFQFSAQEDKAHKPWFSCKPESCACFTSGNKCNLEILIFYLGESFRF